MKKPHEQELAVHPSDFRVVINADGLIVADVREPPNTGGFEFAALFAAALDMARALMAFVSEDGHTPDCGSTLHHERSCSTECAAARTALRKAGVLK